ncbi:succinate-semialdehyde dehydrogenase/glutarate-semialdehyde dehydrogenase [Kribbella aluminosa]|uniref:Succinate-semialdehyde dehydrogenase/glutarate-semialdehyde dehydrogenase n=1 Tax=Kribbella aluminosa TaxID=416017 RepID=A0ABS4UJA5_9ACTN|nr:NAD-dependent succinate-semialdehyde dehydrogenase [Kribbella aluminosa]MBP2351757.1 succinate-semialdehyde dehydrogenase/glutarate-semialdehyde dehydrogenase [Kribbella aluminosa]
MTVVKDRVLDESTDRRTGIYIAGKWVAPANRAVFAVDDPATGQIVQELLDATPDDAVLALDAAADAQRSWALTPPRVRSEILRRAFELVLEKRDVLASTITREMGKSLAEAHAEVTYGAEFLRWFAEEAVRVHGRSMITPEGTGLIHVSRRPVGPCYLVTPWNFPLAMLTRKVGPALAAGCTVVIKPADLTPLTALLVVEILAEAGAPDGVVNLVTTTQPAPISTAMLGDERLRKISFTGSTQVGRILLTQAAQRVLRCSMELGGNAPFIVLEGADVDAAVEGAMLAKFRNVGQACTAANRFHVHHSLADEFAAKLAAKAGALKLGPGSDPGVDLGPMISDAAVERTIQIVDDAVQRGATVLTGGRRPKGEGSFLEPTVLADVQPGSRALAEEIFGPVAPVARFDSVAEALAAANDTEYGLASYVYAPSLDVGHAFASGLEAGMVGVNTGLVSNAAAPFGGVKSSGLGREGGTEGIEEYLTTRYAASPEPRLR